MIKAKNITQPACIFSSTWKTSSVQTNQLNNVSSNYVLALKLTFVTSGFIRIKNVLQNSWFNIKHNINPVRILSNFPLSPKINNVN